MNRAVQPKPDPDFYHRLKWLMFFRLLFATLMLGSTIVLQMGESLYPLNQPLIILYGLTGGIFLLSVIYNLIFYRVREKRGGIWFAYVQVGIDTLIVTLLIFLTGSYSSLFSFLYLVVIIYTSMLLFRKGSMVMAAFSSIQYGIMVDLEYYGILTPFGTEASLVTLDLPWSHVLYKVMIIMLACFAVAFLSGLLAEQARKTKRELQAMSTHVKRVERMAMVGEMAAGLAHEIKNPLASLRGSVQLLKDDIPYDPDRDKLMGIVLREADRLSTLVTDFLTFARPKTGRTEPVELAPALADIITLFERDTRIKGAITLRQRIASDIWIHVDRSHLHQIVLNLLLNAAQAIGEGSGEIRITTEPQRNRHVALKISDNGCGMSDEVMNAIFDPFFTTKPSGTGLGLSIVHRIVETYEGWIDIESEEGEGTTFTLVFKMIPPPRPPAAG